MIKNYPQYILKWKFAPSPASSNIKRKVKGLTLEAHAQVGVRPHLRPLCSAPSVRSYKISWDTFGSDHVCYVAVTVTYDKMWFGS